MDEVAPDLTPEAFLTLLRQDGVVTHADARLMAFKQGGCASGVTSEIHRVKDGPDTFLIKRTLGGDTSAALNRMLREWQFTEYVANFTKDSVPTLRRCQETGAYFTMNELGSEFSNWKQQLLSKHMKPEDAKRAGELLAGIHKHSENDEGARTTFGDDALFVKLRIEAYLLTTAAKHGQLRSSYEAEAERLKTTRECVIHGDFAPHNILVSQKRMVLMNGEVACYGDPAFDIAFMLSHFYLMALRHAPHRTGARQMIKTFWTSYLEVRTAHDLQPRVARLLLMLLLAQVDGAYPVEYLDGSRQHFVRQFVNSELTTTTTSLSSIAALWFDQMASHFEQ